MRYIVMMVDKTEFIITESKYHELCELLDEHSGNYAMVLNKGKTVINIAHIVWIDHDEEYHEEE
jgi:hypothetical protein